MKHTFITKSDLAQAYFPHLNTDAARHKLMSLIEGNKKLFERLTDSGYERKVRILSPLQVDIIMETFGNPFK